MVEYKAQIIVNGEIRGQIFSYSVYGLAEQLHKLGKLEPRFCELCEKEIPEGDVSWGLTDEITDDRTFCSRECLDKWVESMEIEGVDYV